MEFDLLTIYGDMSKCFFNFQRGYNPKLFDLKGLGWIGIEILIENGNSLDCQVTVKACKPFS